MYYKHRVDLLLTETNAWSVRRGHVLKPQGRLTTDRDKCLVCEEMACTKTTG